MLAGNPGSGEVFIVKAGRLFYNFLFLKSDPVSNAIKEEASELHRQFQ
jgi:hypothetical protein